MYSTQVPWHATGGNEKYIFDNENVSLLLTFTSFKYLVFKNIFSAVFIKYS